MTVDSVDVEAQIGRPPRVGSEVVARCHLGKPVVIKVPPLLDDGTPFPTTYWLTCPLARIRIGRLEAAGGVRRLEAKAENDSEFGAALEEAHQRYVSERDEMIPAEYEGPTPSGGVGGSPLGKHRVKCLHAHYADTAAGNDNPVGQLVADWIEPLDCVITCVEDGIRNPEWSARP